jgi:hypothetical protein
MQVIEVSAKTKEGMQPWLQLLHNRRSGAKLASSEATR